MDENQMIDREFSAVQQEIIKAIRHIALRNNVTQGYVRVAMQTVLDNQIINLKNLAYGSNYMYRIVYAHRSVGNSQSE